LRRDRFARPVPSKKATKLLDFLPAVVYDRGTPVTTVKMDIVKALRELYHEKKRLDAAIAGLEARIRAAAHTGSAAKVAKGRRGRKSMSAAERLEVSKRMTVYWVARRAQRHPPPAPSQAPPPSVDQQVSTTSAS
jgi:hypothetical protein